MRFTLVCILRNGLFTVCTAFFNFKNNILFIEYIYINNEYHFFLQIWLRRFNDSENMPNS